MTRLGIVLLLVAVVCGRPRVGISDDTAEAAPPKRAAYVASRVALGRSGPSMDHYATDVLAVGEKVEILEQQQDWVGIRPPEGSFSWIDASLVEKLDGSLARVSSDGATVWIGSAVTAVAEHAEQVQLRKGERVEVLEEKTVEGADGTSSTWLKIRPPAGELRWVKQSELSSEAPKTSLSERKTKGSSGPATGESPEAARKEGEPRVRRERHDDLVWVDRRVARSKTEDGASIFVDRTATLDGRTFEDRFTILQLKIARASAAGATEAELRRLQTEVEDLVRTGKTAYERGRATLLLENVRELRTLAERRSGLVEPASFELAADAARPIGEEAGASDSLYVATGWLMPVASSDKRSAPPYVVMNDDGHPVAFVTPAPSLNLRRYVDKEVGIVGESSFNVLDRKHVVAHRVVELERHRSEDGEEPRPSVPWIRFRRSDAAQ